VADQEREARRATPRPTFDRPTVIRRADTAHHVWGDEQSGLVTDRVYVSSDTLHVLEFELAPGGEFRHSPLNKTVFAADVLYFVREGELTMADPQHGEVQVVEAGAGVLFRRGTWHHGFNPTSDTLRVTEFFAPPPSRGTASVYARTQPDLEEIHYRDDRWDQRWPDAAAEQQAVSRLQVVRPSNALWSFAADRPSHRVGTLVDTEHLSVAVGRVQAGHVEDLQKVADESLLLVTDGELWVDTRDEETSQFAPACLLPGDAVFVPRGDQLRVLNRSGHEARYVTGAGRPVADGWTP
jgi:mannose-6-phosphate isomerase-like protein (cupin superfamily)